MPQSVTRLGFPPFRETFLLSQNSVAKSLRNEKTDYLEPNLQVLDDPSKDSHHELTVSIAYGGFNKKSTRKGDLFTEEIEKGTHLVLSVRGLTFRPTDGGMVRQVTEGDLLPVACSG